MELTSTKFEESVNLTTLEQILSKNSFDNISELYRYNNCDKLINSSMENEELEFSQFGNVFKCKYEKNGDITSALSMCIFFYSDLYEILDNCKYVVKINETPIISCNLRTITQFDRMMIFDKFAIIKLPNDWLIGKFISISDKLGAMCIEIHSDNTHVTNKINKIMLNYEMIYYESFFRVWLKNNTHAVKFQQLEENPLSTKTDKTATYVIKSKSIHRGYFIESPNLASIQNISCQMISENNKSHTRFNYSKWMILANSVRVSNNMIYLPINNNFDYKEISMKSISGGTIDMTAVYKVGMKELQLVLTYEDNYVNTKIYSLCLNVMTYKDGNVTVLTNINVY